MNARGAVKLAGIGQRVVGGGSHTGVVLVVEGEERINEVLAPVYAALGLDWAPRRDGLGSDQRSPSASWAAVRDALVTEYAREYDIVGGRAGLRDARAGADAGREHRVG